VFCFVLNVFVAIIVSVLKPLHGILFYFIFFFYKKGGMLREPVHGGLVNQCVHRK
jgi:hypothetical protein